MYEVTILPEAIASLQSIEDDDEFDDGIQEDLDLLGFLLETIPLRIGRARFSSVHRMASHGRIFIEYEVIEDDKRVLIHSFGMFPGP